MPRVSKKEGSRVGEKYVNLQGKLIENLIELQKVHTSMAEKFDKLSGQITSLLTLFEMAAKSFAEHPSNQGTEKDKEFLDKIDKLLDQNKTIAKGLTLMEERIRERVYGFSPQKSQPQTMGGEKKEDEYKQTSSFNRPLPKF